MTQHPDRRRLLKGVAAATAGVLLPRIRWRESTDFEPWVEVHAANIRHNLAEVHRRAARPVLAVVKNHGYGLGHLNLANVLEPEPPIAGFAVIKLGEAVALRDSGIRKPVLWMGVGDRATLDEAIARDITPMIDTPIGATLAAIARRRRRRVSVQVHVDTGMGREGVPYRQAKAVLDNLLGAPEIEIAGVMTVLSEDPKLDREQVKRLTELVAPYRARGARLGVRHAVSSLELFGDPNAFLDQVRPGMALWGVYSEARLRPLGVLDLKPAGALRARVAYVKRLEAGESAGYERAFQAREATWVAVVPMGHVDGVPRLAARGGSIRIGDRLSPIVAVSASHTIVALGSEATCRRGDVATLFDWMAGSRPEDVGAACGVSHYDLMMHLDPSLPRRVVADSGGRP